MEKLSPTIGDKEREVLNKRLESISEGLRKSIEDFLTHLNATAAQEDRVELRIEMYRNDPPRMIIRKKSEEAHKIFGIEAEDIYNILIGRTGLYQMLECDNCPLKTTRGE